MWAQIFLPEGLTPVIQLLSLFHDYSLAIILIILIFVAGVSLSLVINTFLSDSLVATIVEFVWTVVPVIILCFLAIPSLKILYLLEEHDPFVSFKVLGHQWYWSYELIETEFDSYMNPFRLGESRLLDVDHRLVLPVNKSIRGLIRGADVIHSWTLPSLGVKADAVPGRLNQVNFDILRRSVIYGQCSEICGANHRFIPISVEGVTVEFFLKWVELL